MIQVGGDYVDQYFVVLWFVDVCFFDCERLFFFVYYGYGDVVQFCCCGYDIVFVQIGQVGVLFLMVSYCYWVNLLMLDGLLMLVLLLDVLMLLNGLIILLFMVWLLMCSRLVCSCLFSFSVWLMLFDRIVIDRLYLLLLVSFIVFLLVLNGIIIVIGVKIFLWNVGLLWFILLRIVGLKNRLW